MSFFRKPPKAPPPLPAAYFRPPAVVPAIWRFKLPLTWTPGHKLAITRICLEPDPEYEPLIGAKRPGSRSSRGNFMVGLASGPGALVRLDAVALMDSCVHGPADAESNKLPDLVGDLSARLVKLAHGDQGRAGDAVGVIIDFIQGHAAVRGESMKTPISVDRSETLRAWVEYPRGDQYVVFYGVAEPVST